MGKEEFQYSQLENGIIRIDTPFIDNSSDGVVIYAIANNNDEITLTDDGWTLDGLKSHGIFLNRSKQRRDLFKRQLKIYGVSEDDGELYIVTDLKNTVNRNTVCCKRSCLLTICLCCLKRLLPAFF